MGELLKFAMTPSEMYPDNPHVEEVPELEPPLWKRHWIQAASQTDSSRASSEAVEDMDIESGSVSL